jgi:hypothetical protein
MSRYIPFTISYVCQFLKGAPYQMEEEEEIFFGTTGTRFFFFNMFSLIYNELCFLLRVTLNISKIDFNFFDNADNIHTHTLL